MHYHSLSNFLVIVLHFRSNRTPLKEGYYAIGAIKSNVLNDVYEDDLLAVLGLESLCTVQYFTRLQAGSQVYHSRMYKRVSKRNSYTVAYRKGRSIVYGQIEMYFCAGANAHLQHGAVIVPMPTAVKQCISEQNDILGITPVSHIVVLNQPKQNQADIVSVDDIVELCVFIELSDITYVAHFPNRYEKD